MNLTIWCSVNHTCVIKDGVRIQVYSLLQISKVQVVVFVSLSGRQYTTTNSKPARKKTKQNLLGFNGVYSQSLLLRKILTTTCAFYIKNAHTTENLELKLDDE